tara:strand:+ start:2813 stop:3061 length:249 start_codon:yes stop_codon:yes gene_type:complete
MNKKFKSYTFISILIIAYSIGLNNFYWGNPISLNQIGLTLLGILIGINLPKLVKSFSKGADKHFEEQAELEKAKELIRELKK